MEEKCRFFAHLVFPSMTEDGLPPLSSQSSDDVVQASVIRVLFCDSTGTTRAFNFHASNLSHDELLALAHKLDDEEWHAYTSCNVLWDLCARIGWVSDSPRKVHLLPDPAFATQAAVTPATPLMGVILVR